MRNPLKLYTAPDRSKDITCVCGGAHKHHRLSGGKCDGSAWCTSFRSIDSHECDCCPNNNQGTCEVTTGQELVTGAPCYLDELRTRRIQDEYGNLPLDWEDYWENKQREYYETDD